MTSTAFPTATIHSPGLHALVQDLGRGGHEPVGVPTSGAFDRDAHTLANALVTNDPQAATVEFVAHGPTLSFSHDVVVALTGPVTGILVDGQPRPARHALLVRAGQHLYCGTARGRGYLAVTGGFTPAMVLGSRSRCSLSGLGPDPLRAGATVPVGAGALRPGRAARDLTRPAGALRVLPGPDLHLLDPAAVEAFTTRSWEVSPDSTRVGVRLSGTLPNPPQESLPSKGMVTGAVQVTPAGTPVILGPDHGTTGGYPVPFVVAGADLPRLAHLMPGDTLRFTLASADPAPDRTGSALDLPVLS